MKIQNSTLERLKQGSILPGSAAIDSSIKNLGQISEQKNKSVDEKSSKSFLDHLKSGIENTNKMHLEADQKAVDLASGKSSRIHETMLSVTQAELSFNLMVQIRNRALEAYQEIMRMPV